MQCAVSGEGVEKIPVQQKRIVGCTCGETKDRKVVFDIERPGRMGPFVALGVEGDEIVLTNFVVFRVASCP